MELRARRAVLRAVGLLRLACGIHCADDNEETDRLRVELARCREHVALLQSRLARIEPRHRPATPPIAALTSWPSHSRTACRSRTRPRPS